MKMDFVNRQTNANLPLNFSLPIEESLGRSGRQVLGEKMTLSIMQEPQNPSIFSTKVKTYRCFPSFTYIPLASFL